jgi:hypothetical protein
MVQCLTSNTETKVGHGLRPVAGQMEKLKIGDLPKLIDHSTPVS